MPPESFAAEVAKAKASRGEAPPPAADPAAAAAEPHPLEMTMPQHGEVHPEQKAAAEGDAAAAQSETTPAAPKQGKIKIGTETFDTAEEALAYAEQLQQTLVQKDAFELGRQSVEANQKKEEPAQEKTWVDEVEEKFFENPREAIQKIYQKAVEDTKTSIRQEDAQAKSRQEAWDNFYSSNSDLATQREVVDFVLQKNWNELGSLPAEKGLKLLAEKTRAFLGSARVATLPAKELQSGPAIVPGASSAATTPPPQKKSEALDFISQVNKHRRRNA